MKRLFCALICAFALLQTVSLAPVRAQSQEGSRPSLFPSNKAKGPDMKAVADSLQGVIDSLRARIAELERIEEVMVEEAATEGENESGEEAPEIQYTPEVIDSLLHEWYTGAPEKQSDVHARFDDLEHIGEFYGDSVRFTSSVPDSVLVARLEAMNSYISLPFNYIVKNYMLLYSEKNPAKMRRMLALSEYYFPIFEEALNKYDLPLEIKYLAIIESALNPTARSRVGARGLWQFMYGTGRVYGLRINSYVDERLDVVKSTDAACRYLADAYKIFGDWTLAISSYNCGPGNVNKAIRRAGGRRDFWSVYPYLPRETRGYMPAFVGAMYAMVYARENGLVADPSPLPARVDTFMISKNLHFTQVSDLTGITMDEIRDLNSQYIHDIIPGSQAEYALRLPYQYTASFIDCQDSLYTHLADSLFKPAVVKSISEGGAAPGGGNVIYYKVRSGDYLGRIAGRYHVSVKQIMSWNHMKNTNLRVGQTLTIYQGGGPPERKPEKKKPKSKYSPGYDGPVEHYTVKAGDSLYGISRQFPGVTVADIMALNNCGSNIRPGQTLKIPKL